MIEEIVEVLRDGIEQDYTIDKKILSFEMITTLSKIDHELMSPIF